MLDLEEKTSGVNILKRKRFTIIKVVDKKLNDLTKELIKNQKIQIDILSRIEEINGLLIDLIT